MSDHSRQATQRRLSATTVLVLVTAAISLVLDVAPDWVDAPMRAGFIPARISGVGTDFAAVPAWLTPLTSAFVHAGVLHLVSNLLILIVTGRACEAAIGPARLILLYAIGAYAAAFAQWLPDPMSVTPMVGASGAASAIFGAYALLYGRSRALPIGPVPAWIVTALWLAAAWIVVNLLGAYALASAGIGLAAAAHIGGFVCGLVLARPLLRWKRRRG